MALFNRIANAAKRAYDSTIGAGLANYRVGKYLRRIDGYTLDKMFRWFVTNADRSGDIDAWGMGFGGNVPQNSTTSQDMAFRDYNSSVAISVRSIANSMASLPLRAMEKQSVRGKERLVENTDHPVLDVIKKPNPEHTFDDIITLAVKSYFDQGNAYIAIEREVDGSLELWHKNPAYMNVQTNNSTGKVIGYKYSRGLGAKYYKREEMIHVRSPEPDKPFYGISAFDSTRNEIELAYHVNMFPLSFFRNGGKYGNWFVPNNNLTQDQYDQLLSQLRGQNVSYADAFKMFISQVAGKLQTVDNKLKDMDFEALNRITREKIFGTAGLPPSRAGVLEYANYSNMVAQEKDYWNNTMFPLLRIFAKAFTKQFLWVYFDEEHEFQFDTSEIQALKGDPKEQAEIHTMYKNAGVLTADEIRADLDLEPLPKDEGQQTPQDEEPAPPEDEGEEATDSLHKIFRHQKNDIAARIKERFPGGRGLYTIFDASKEAHKLFNVNQETRHLRESLMPTYRSAIRTIGTAEMEINSNGSGTFKAFNMKSLGVDDIQKAMASRIEDINVYSVEMLAGYLADAYNYKWDLDKLIKNVRSIFTLDRAEKIIGKHMDYIVQSFKTRNIKALEDRVNNRIDLKQLTLNK